jgi:uncharacterized protein
MKNFFYFIANLPKRVAVSLINIYQATLSPDHSWLKARFAYGYCRHYPSCSEYSKQAIGSRGLIKGGWLSIKRLATCHPWAEPKIDLVEYH